MVLSLQTTTFSAHGGIPAYNRLVCRVLNDFCEAREGHLLVAMDRASDVEKAAPELQNLQMEAFEGSRVAFCLRFMQLAFSLKFDLVLIGHINYAPLGWILKQFKPHLRYGVVLYGIEAWQPLGKMRRRALQQADFIISISEYTKERAIEINSLNENRIFRLPNAVEHSSTDLLPTTHKPDLGVTRLLSVCRLDKSEQYKGVDKVIESLPLVVKQVANVEYTVVGAGTDLERHKAIARRLGIEDRVHFVGFVDDDTLQSCYRDCDVFVMPSRGEGFGFVFLEAMKYAKPIVAARSGGAPEVVLDGVTGSLVEYDNRDQLTKAIVDLCQNSNKRRDLGLAGYQRLQDNFTFAHFKKRLTDILVRELPAQTLAPGARQPAASSVDSL